MHNEETKTTSTPRRAIHGPGGRGGVAEKPKDFGNAIKKMVHYLHDFVPMIIVALVLASLSSVFSIIGPNKLSDLTDTITEGITLDADKLQDVTNEFSSVMDSDRIQTTLTTIATPSLTDHEIETVLEGDFSASVKNSFRTFLQNASSMSQEELLSTMLSFPLEIQDVILPGMEMGDEYVSTEDRVAIIQTLADNSFTLSTLPVDVQKVLFPEMVYDGITVSSEDQVALIEKLQELDDTTDASALYAKIDEMPESIQLIVNPKMDFETINNICLFLLILYSISALFNFIQSFIMATVANNFAKSLRTKISHKINRLPLKYFDTHSYGDILSRVTNDVDTIGMSMYQSLGSLVGAFTLFIGSIIMMFATNWIMAITAILSSLIGFVFMFIILNKSQKYFTARQVELGKLNGHIEEIYSSHNVVKAYNGEKESSKKFDTFNEAVYICNKRSQFLSGMMQPIMAFIGNFSYVAVCIAGALLVINDQISFGVIIAFIIYVRLFTNPLSQIAQGMTNLQTTAAAGERVFEFLEEPEMKDERRLKGQLDPEKVKGSIQFKHVQFGYSPEKTIIKDFNCKVSPGEKIAIVGPTGAGKTTMVNLLMKFYDINSGDITIDGVSIKDLSREQIHALFIMVLQDTWLFAGTVRDNIRYNKEDVSDPEIWEALKVVGVDHFVKSLPGGLDYQLGDNDSISAGQKQLLTIARGMIKNAPFLILDEATSSVDTRTEELVQQAMDKLTEGRTSFIIAHRLSTIKNADLILVMKDGNIIEQGNHDELMKQNGFYADLYNSQFKKDA